MSLQEIIDKIKEKRELRGISDKIVKTEIESYFKKYKIKEYTINPRGMGIIVKEIRKTLRRFSGQYQLETKRDLNFSSSSVLELLKSHTSTSERINFYPELIKFIKESNFTSVLDLGCGLNPLALAEELGVIYYASDIKEDELDIIRDYFKTKKIKGEVFFCDLRNITEDLPPADLCLVFKVFDIISDKRNRSKLVSSLISKIDSKFFLVSFSTKKLSGKKMNYPKRKWFEHLLKKNNTKFNTFSSDNEIFYFFQK